MKHQFQYPVTLTFFCTNCAIPVEFDVELEDLNRWDRREDHVQNIFPYLTPAQREMFLSGICEECFDRMFKTQ